MRTNAVLDGGEGGATGCPQLIHEAGEAAQGGHILGQAAGDPVRQLGAAGGMDALVVGQAGQQLLHPGGEGLLKGSLGRLVLLRQVPCSLQLFVKSRHVSEQI